MNIQHFISLLKKEGTELKLEYEDHRFCVVIPSNLKLSASHLNVYYNSPTKHKEFYLLTKSKIQGQLIDVYLPFKSQKFDPDFGSSFSLMFSVGEETVQSPEFLFKHASSNFEG